MEQPLLGALVLTGGGAARLDGADKASVEIGGRTLLEYTLDALIDVDDVVVVGPEVITDRPVTFRREEPAGGGPAAAVVAGLSGFPRMPRRVVVLAVDMPLVNPHTIRRLAESFSGEGALLVDERGHRQYLCGMYDVARLLAAGAGDTFGMSMRDLLRGMELVEVAARGGEARDVDTWADVQALREEYPQ